MKHLTATLLLVFSVLIAGPSAAQNEYVLTNEELIQQGRQRVAENYATAIERVVLSLAEALRTDHSGTLYEYLSAHDNLEGLKTLEGFNRQDLSLSDAEIDQYVNLGLHAVALAEGGPSPTDPYPGELIVFAGREDWQPSNTGPIYMHGGVTKTDILQAGRGIIKMLVGQVDHGFFKQANYKIRRVEPQPLSAGIIERLPTVPTAAAYIPVRAAYLEASISSTTETRRFPCAEGFHGAGVIKHRETSNSINGYDEITPTHGDWDERARYCDADTTRTITKNVVCNNKIGSTWYTITESVRKAADDPFVTERFLDTATKKITRSTCDFSREVQTDSTKRDEHDVRTCASVYPDATPAWEGDVTYDRRVTIENIYYVDDPENFVVNEKVPDWTITREECSRLIPRNIVEHKLLDCLPPYLQRGGAWRENRILRKIYREHKGGRFVLIRSTPDAWQPDSNSCRNVVTSVFNEYKTASGPCATYTYRRSGTQIITSYQDGRPDGVITRLGDGVNVGASGRGGRRLLKHSDHGGGSGNNDPCGGGNSGGGGGGDPGHDSNDGHVGHGDEGTDGPCC